MKSFAQVTHFQRTVHVQLLELKASRAIIILLCLNRESKKLMYMQDESEDLD